MPSYEFGPFRLDPVERQLWRDGEEIRLAAKSFDVLFHFVRNPKGRMISKDEFMSTIWPDVIVDETSLTGNVSILRQALGDDAREPKYIQTVSRRGYRFLAPVREVKQPRPDLDLVVVDEVRTRVVVEETTETNRRGLAIALVAAVTIAAAVMLFWAKGSRAKQTPPDRSLTRGVPTVVPLTTFRGDEFTPALSPDGKLVAFCWTAEDRRSINIYVKQVEVGSPIRLTYGPGREGGPSWSPDGRYVAFWRGGEPQDAGIFIVPALGGAERRVVAGYAGGVSWSPDGKSLAFLRGGLGASSPDSPLSIWIASVATGESRQVTRPPTDVFGDYTPAFSPDGRRIAFVRLGENGEGGDLHLLDVASGALQQLTHDGRRIVGVTWDNNSIIFSSNRSGRSTLWRISADGGTPEPVEPFVEDAFEPAASPQSGRLAYTRIQSDSNIYAIDLAHSNRESLLIGSSRKDSFPRISPDGRRIAFKSDRGGSNEIWIASADGSNPSQLTSLQGMPTTPCWSPDSKEIAFVLKHGTTGDIFVMPADGGSPKRLEIDASSVVSPSWSRDGRSIYFAASRGGAWQIWRVPSSGGTAEQVTRNGGYESVESYDGRWIYYNKRGFSRVGVFRQPVEGGTEELMYALPQLNSFGDWALASNGLYFIHRYDGPITPAAVSSIRFLDFATQKVREIARLPRDPGGDPGLSLSRDGRSLIYSRVDSVSHDLMLVSNYH
jgi:Tol biopolymer transport system component/DNA-binding winged helix-turn-helix (wHTH) protein